MKKIPGYILAVAACAALASCSVTKNLAEDQYILNKNEIVTDHDAPRTQRIAARDLNRYIRQHPAPKLLGTNLPIWIYNQAEPGNTNGWNNFLRRLGSQPTILDTTLTHISATNLKLYMDSRGFRESVSDYRIEYKPKRQRANVTYTVWQGQVYRIGGITYDFQDRFLEQVIAADRANTLLHSGDPFDTNVMNDERTRIAAYLRDRGYFNFSVDNIQYIVYMDEGDYEVDIEMVFRQHFAGFDEADRPVTENSAVYRLRNIFVFPNYDSAEAAAVADSSHHVRFDTVYYRGIGVVSEGVPKVKPSTLRRAVNLYSGDIYSLTDTRRAVENLIRLGFYTSANVAFSEVPQGGEDEYVTYVGAGGGSGQAAQQTAMRELDCNVYCTPALRHSFSVDMEGTVSGFLDDLTFYGIKINGKYMNRNLFRGSELFDLGITAGYEFFRSGGLGNAFEFGVTAGITFPRFLTPFPVDMANRALRPSTRLDASISAQRSPGNYERTITAINLSYAWSGRGNNSYILRPLSFNLVKSELDPDYEEELINLGNLYLIESYRTHFIPAISFSHVYNNQILNRRGHSLVIRSNIEESGNVFVTAVGAFDDSEDYSTLFGVRITQYVRGDVNAAYTIPFAGSWAVAGRLYAGVAIPYGNSVVMPVGRQFYAGGAYSMRGWNVRTLGPGNSPEPDWSQVRFPMQIGDIRLEANAELRFPVSGILHGAFFFDLGNIWKLPRTADNADQEFRFNKFYKQLGFNTGTGVRLDFQLIVFRLDMGLQLHNPNRPAGDRWLTRFDWNNTAFSFGVGYPF